MSEYGVFRRRSESENLPVDSMAHHSAKQEVAPCCEAGTPEARSACNLIRAWWYAPLEIAAILAGTKNAVAPDSGCGDFS